MSDGKIKSSAVRSEEKLSRSKADFYDFTETYLDKGWCPTKCSYNCVVEPDGVRTHGFQSVTLEHGFI